MSGRLLSRSRHTPPPLPPLDLHEVALETETTAPPSQVMSSASDNESCKKETNPVHVVRVVDRPTQLEAGTKIWHGVLLEYSDDEEGSRSSTPVSVESVYVLPDDEEKKRRKEALAAESVVLPPPTKQRARFRDSLTPTATPEGFLSGIANAASQLSASAPSVARTRSRGLPSVRSAQQGQSQTRSIHTAHEYPSPVGENGALLEYAVDDEDDDFLSHLPVTEEENENLMLDAADNYMLLQLLALGYTRDLCVEALQRTFYRGVQEAVEYLESGETRDERNYMGPKDNIEQATIKAELLELLGKVAQHKSLGAGVVETEVESLIPSSWKGSQNTLEEIRIMMLRTGTSGNALDRSDFGRMPNEILYHVFSFLDAKSLSRAGCVCRGWNDMSKLDSLWKPLVAQDWNIDDWLEYVHSQLEMASTVKQAAEVVALLRINDELKHPHSNLHPDAVELLPAPRLLKNLPHELRTPRLTYVSRFSEKKRQEKDFLEFKAKEDRRLHLYNLDKRRKPYRVMVNILVGLPGLVCLPVTLISILLFMIFLPLRLDRTQVTPWESVYVPALIAITISWVSFLLALVVYPLRRRHNVAWVHIEQDGSKCSPTEMMHLWIFEDAWEDGINKSHICVPRFKCIKKPKISYPWISSWDVKRIRTFPIPTHMLAKYIYLARSRTLIFIAISYLVLLTIQALALMGSTSGIIPIPLSVATLPFLALLFLSFLLYYPPICFCYQLRRYILRFNCWKYPLVTAWSFFTVFVPLASFWLLIVVKIDGNFGNVFSWYGVMFPLYYMHVTLFISAFLWLVVAFVLRRYRDAPFIRKFQDCIPPTCNVWSLFLLVVSTIGILVFVFELLLCAQLENNLDISYTTLFIPLFIFAVMALSIVLCVLGCQGGFFIVFNRKRAEDFGV